ncbi:hypothetical protein H9L10_01860 [Phycicoccus endophyticus]|uniref:Cell wall-active antibiotics response LiaF-like C-terminal domain-containing protein n=1 Tax=Phycicoccus endophyticus TaxID=1690220 RepID=A0A7G9R2N6_9MICO|nr:hypothetical protein [Phycicoccus endophyticus]QNN49861.1 hypothetical protein H9L10_01860 [Phycicoccus endophyticus]
MLALVGLGVALAEPLGFPGEPVVLGMSLALGGASLVVLTLGAAGRAAGFSGLLVVVLGVLTAVTALGSHVPGGRDVGDRTWSPTVATVPVRYELGAGDATLDLRGLTRLPEDPAAPPAVDVSLGVGQLTVEVPAGLDVRVESHLRAGDLRYETRDTDGLTVAVDDHSGTRLTRTHRVGDGPPELVVRTDVGLGAVTIIEQEG